MPDENEQPWNSGSFESFDDFIEHGQPSWATPESLEWMLDLDEDDRLRLFARFLRRRQQGEEFGTKDRARWGALLHGLILRANLDHPWEPVAYVQLPADDA